MENAEAEQPLVLKVFSSCCLDPGVPSVRRRLSLALSAFNMDADLRDELLRTGTVPDYAIV
jgi:hypothetical protein